MNSECPLQKLKWNSLCSFKWRTGKERQIFVILLSKRCYPIYVNVFRFCTSNFFTDDGCEHAKMKQFTLVAGNIRSQCTLFWKNHWIVNPEIQSRLVTVLNWSFCLETVSYLGVMQPKLVAFQEFFSNSWKAFVLSGSSFFQRFFSWISSELPSKNEWFSSSDVR